MPPNIPDEPTLPRYYSWSEVKEHNNRNDRWIVIEGHIYDVTRWAGRHPGGHRVISHYGGQDASEAYMAFHKDKAYSAKYMKALRVGQLDPKEYKKGEIDNDFRELRKTAEDMGLFKPNYLFFAAHLAQIMVLEVLAYLVMLYWGTGWGPYLLSLVLMGTSQAQASWNQHDYGHVSVFPSPKVDYYIHKFIMGSIKGAAPQWWKHMHNQHHAKPNVIDKDPDVRIESVFVVGEDMPKKIANSRKNSMPYNWQHRYFFAIGPPLLFPVYFQFMVFYYTIKHKFWTDLLWMMVFYTRFVVLFTPLLGFGGTIAFFFLVRCFESHWFTWVSQSNHIPMHIEEDKAKPWVALQISATCDVEQSFFNDWFTGHLNFQCEHHLFPTMPRHNYHKIAPLVKSLCQKHNIPYHTKPLMTAFKDIVRSLKHSGDIWQHAYAELHGGGHED